MCKFRLDMSAKSFSQTFQPHLNIYSRLMPARATLPGVRYKDEAVLGKESAMGHY
jgi:hypothetical protein